MAAGDVIGLVGRGQVMENTYIPAGYGVHKLVRFGVDCNQKGQVVGTVGRRPVVIHSSGQTISSLPHIEGIVLGAGEEVDKVAGGAGGMDVDGIGLKIKIHKTIILPVVLYGCETWSLTLRLRVFENRILRRIFGPKGDENGEWRRLHNVEFHSLYLSPNIVRVIKSRRLRWSGHVARMEEGRTAFKILTGKPTG